MHVSRTVIEEIVEGFVEGFLDKKPFNLKVAEWQSWQQPQTTRRRANQSLFDRR